MNLVSRALCFLKERPLKMGVNKKNKKIEKIEKKITEKTKP
jgi:hypothetical protein